MFYAHHERGKTRAFATPKLVIQAHVATPKHVIVFKDMLQHPNTCFCHSQTRYHIQAHAATPNTTVSCINHKIPQALVQI